jgi:hypothetical protein
MRLALSLQKVFLLLLPLALFLGPGQTWGQTLITFTSAEEIRTHFFKWQNNGENRSSDFKSLNFKESEIS